MMCDKNFIISFVRHGESMNNIGAYYEDRFHKDDSPLSDRGFLQAEKLAEHEIVASVDKIYSSPLIRAVQTVYPVAEKLDKRVVILPDLIEINTEIAGTDTAYLEKEYPLAIPCITAPTPTGGPLFIQAENDEIRIERARRCIEYFRSEAQEGEHLLVVSHGSFLTYLLTAALGYSDIEHFSFQADNCGVTRIIYRKNKCPKLSFANFTAHLGGMPLCNF